MRVVYDIIFIVFVSFHLLELDDIHVPEFFVLVLPAVIEEMALMVFSVRHSFKKRRKITYRMLKTRITTAEQNDAMWSSDDFDYSKDNKESKAEVQNGINDSFDLEDQKDQIRDITNKSKAGVYEVDFSKPYKPVFLVFCDLVCLVLVLMLSILNRYMIVSSHSKDATFFDVLPEKMIIFLLAFTLKFYFSIVVLKFKGLNKSQKTGGLFWYRVIYDVFVFGSLVFYFHYQSHLDDKESRAKGEKQTGDKNPYRSTIQAFTLLLPCFLLEIVLYFVSVMPAYQRRCYQDHSKWRKGGPDPAKKQKALDEFYESKRFDYHKKIDNDQFRKMNND